MMVLCYHLIMFSDYNLNPDFVYTMGDYFVKFEYALIIINIGYIINREVNNYLRHRKMKGKKKEWNKYIVDRDLRI